jgi:hypothetical protein
MNMNQTEPPNNQPPMMRPNGTPCVMLSDDARKVALEIRNNPRFKLRSMAGLKEETLLTEAQLVAALGELGSLGIIGATTGNNGKTMFGMTQMGMKFIL